MARSFFISLFILLVVPVHAQSSGYLDLLKAESELQELFDRLYSDTLVESEPVLTRIREVMNDALVVEGAMDYPWARLNKIGVITSEDGKVKIFTWHVMDDPDNYRYFGYVQVGLKRGKVRVYELVDNQKGQRNLNKLHQSTDDWCGKLYYKIITGKYKRRMIYTLLGMDFNDTRSTLKTIEAITIQRNQPQFARELFFNGQEILDRIVLEYSSQVAVSVRFDPNIRMITFDHLVPFHPIYNNNYEFYGPDGSFDGLEFDAGTWIFRKDIDARNLD